MKRWLLWLLLSFIALILSQTVYWENFIYTGDQMAADFEKYVHRHHPNSEDFNRFASELCGAPVEYLPDDPASYEVYWGAPDEMEHVFRFQSYTGIVWMGVRAQGRYCLGRYQVTVKVMGRPWFKRPIPTRFDIYRQTGPEIENVVKSSRFLGRYSQESLDVPVGRAPFPGECMQGILKAGESVSFKAMLPEIGRSVQILVGEGVVHTLARSKEDQKLHVQIKRNGTVLPERMLNEPAPERDRERAGGLYEVSLTAPVYTGIKYGLVIGFGKELKTNSPLPYEQGGPKVWYAWR